MIISLISLSGGTISDANLDKYLRRLNADVNTPIGQTEASLAKMVKQGYIILLKEGAGDDQTKEWMVGPRGKIEVGNRGVRELVREIYGENAPDDLAKRINSSLGIKADENDEEDAEEAENRQVNIGQSQRRGPGRPRRNAAEAEED
jgi:hypothetical protein